MIDFKYDFLRKKKKKNKRNYGINFIYIFIRKFPVYFSRESIQLILYQNQFPYRDNSKGVAG